MADCNYNCPEDNLEHTPNECEEFIPGGIDSIGFLKCGQTSITDFSNASQYTTAIGNGDLRLVEAVLAQMPVASPVEGPSTSACGPETRTNTFDRTITYMDYNVSEDNSLFYDQANRRKTYIVAHLCAGDKVMVIESPVKVVSVITVPERENDNAHFEVTLSWRSYNGPEIADSPAGIFNQGEI